MSTLGTGIRSRLGLPPEADDEAVLAAFDSRVAAAAKPTTDPSSPPDGDEDADTDTTTDDDTTVEPGPATPDKVAARTAQHAAEIKRLSAELAAIKAREAAAAKAHLFDGVVQAGKIKPSERESWERRFDAAPEVIREILDNLAPGVAVPVAASAAGTTGPAVDDTDPYADDESFDSLFSVPGAVKG
jgi:hypothetical protein